MASTAPNSTTNSKLPGTCARTFGWSGSVEIGLHVETIRSPSPYFQLRQISAAQAIFSKAVNEYEHYKSKAVVTAYTLTTNSPLASYQDAASMRATGIRSVIRLAAGMKDDARLQPDKGGYWTTETGLVNIFGSPKSSSRPIPKRLPDPSAIASGIDNLAATHEPIVVDLPFNLFADMSEGDLAGYSTEIAQAVLKEVEAGDAGILPRTFYTPEPQRRKPVRRGPVRRPQGFLDG